MIYRIFGFASLFLGSLFLTSQITSAQMLLGPNDLVPNQVKTSMNDSGKNKSSNKNKINISNPLNMSDLGEVTQVLKRFRTTFLYTAPILGIICIFSFLLGFILFVFQKKPKLSVFLMGFSLFIFLIILFFLLWINMVVSLDL